MVHGLFRHVPVNAALMVHVQWEANAYSPAFIANSLYVTQNSEPELMVHKAWAVHADNPILIVHMVW